MNCAADECGEDLEHGAFIVAPGAFDGITEDQWNLIRTTPIAYLPYRGKCPPVRSTRVPLWIAP